MSVNGCKGRVQPFRRTCSVFRQDRMSHPVTSASLLRLLVSVVRPSVSQMSFRRLTRTAVGGLLKRTMRAKGRRCRSDGA